MTSSRLLRAALGAHLTLLFLAGTASAAAPTWQTAVPISSPSSSNSAPAIAVNPRGDAAAIWVRTAAGVPAVQAAARLAGHGWGAPSGLPSGPAVGSPVVGLDDGGRAVAAWTASAPGHQPLWAAVSGPGGWSAPVQIAVTATEPALAVNAHGDAVLAWVAPAGVGETVEAAVRPAGGSWSAPAPVATGASAIFDVHVDVAIDPHGDALVAWSRYGSIYAAARPAGGQWTAETGVSSAKEKAMAPRAALDANGGATIVWESTSKSYGYPVIDGVEGSISGVFGKPQAIGFDGTSTNPSLAIGPGGHAAVAWVRDNGGHSVVQAATRTAAGTAWSKADYLSDGSKNSDAPRAAVDAAGNALVVWDQAAVVGNLPYAAERRAGGAWSSAHALVAPASAVTAPEVAFDSAGDAVAAFVRGNSIQTADYDAAPVLSGVQVPTAGAVGETLTFSASVSDLWSPVTISWDFGDGASATGSPATHAYAAAGDYNVTVTATDGAGNSVHEIHAAHVPAPAAPAPAPAPGSPATIPSGGAQHVFGGLVLKRQTIVVRKRVARVKASCPAATTGGCAGTLRLLSGQKVIGRARFSVAAGGSARIGVKLTRLVAKSRASARAHDGLGATRTTTAKLKLRRG